MIEDNEKYAVLFGFMLGALAVTILVIIFGG